MKQNWKKKCSVTGLTLLLMVLFSSFTINDLHAQQRIAGTVKDTNGMPLPGVNVIQKGTSNGTVTDFDGNFDLSLDSGTNTLVFSFVGYLTTEVEIDSQTQISVTLEEDAEALDEVVVMGYGTQKKSKITGAVDFVNAEELEDAVFNSVDQMLQGRAAGVQITTASGEPGAAPRVRIRGNTSINADSNPLWVVDGIPLTTVPNFSPQEIESFEVLKDAASTAIYGARGAAGVILVKTKRGKVGTGMQIQGSALETITSFGGGYDVLSGNDYATYRNEIATFKGAGLPFPNGADSENLQSIDWVDQIFRSGLREQYNLSAIGGGEDISYFVSSNYLGEDGILVNSDFERVSFRANVDFKGFKDKLQVNVSTNITRSENNGGIIGGGRSRNGSGGSYLNALLAEPLVPSLDFVGSSSTGQIFANPYFDVTRDYRNRVLTDVLATIQTSYKIFDNLTFINSISTNLRYNNDNRFAPSEVARATLNNGLSSLTSERNDDLVLTNYLRYEDIFSEKHQLNVLGGVEYSKFNFFQQQSNGAGLILTDLGVNDVSFADNQTINSSRTQSILQSGFLRAEYSFDDKYLVNGTVRADGSSVFAENNKWGYFPSFGVSWKAINEPFLDTQDIFSDLRLRASWGQVGVQAIPPYNSLSVFGSVFPGGNTPSVFSGVGNTINPGLRPLRLANPNLRWETTETINIGVDAGLLKNRVELSADFYVKKSRDLLQTIAIPAQTGFSQALVNLGEIENRGLEISLTVRPVAADNFSWTSAANGTFNKSEVIDLGTNPRIISGGTHLFQPGEEFGVFFGRRNAGLIQQSDFDTNGDPTFATFGLDNALGQIRYQDLDGDGTIGNPNSITNFDADETVIGNPNPDFIFGWNNDFRYKNFTLNMFIQGSIGNDIMNQTGALLHSGNAADGLDAINNQSVSYFNNRFIPGVNEHNDPRYPRSGSTTVPYAPLRGIVSDVWIEDGSYARLKNVSLRYHLPIESVSLEVFVTGTNLLTLTNYSGADPEVSQNVESASLRPGIDLSPYPLTKQYSLGLNINF